MADYTFNYSLLFINHRLINLSVDCPWDLSPQGWFPVPTPGSRRRAVLFLPSYQRPRTRLSGGSTSLLLLVTCKDSTWDWGVWPQCPQSHLASQVVPPWSCPGTVIPSVAHCDSASSCGAQFFISQAFINSENREAAGDRWVRSVSVMVQDCEEVERGLLRLGRKSRRGCEGGMHNLLVCTPSAPWRDWCVYTAVRIFLKSPFWSSFLSLPSNKSLHNKFMCNDWKFCTEKQNIKILLEPAHMLGNIKSSLN